MVMAEERNQKPPPIPMTPYSAGVPPAKYLISPITKPNSPPRNKSQTIISRRVLFIHPSFGLIVHVVCCFVSSPNQYRYRCRGLHADDVFSCHSLFSSVTSHSCISLEWSVDIVAVIRIPELRCLRCNISSRHSGSIDTFR